MELQKGYEVVRFIEQGSMTRIMMDYRKGILLFHLLQENNQIQKKLLYRWIESLVMQITLFQNSQKNQCYRYLSPESILVTGEGELYLLDLEAESNSFVMRNMQKREMRQHFMKKEMNFKQNQKLEIDLYSLGKTIQFILAHAKLDEPLTKTEERKLDRFIQKCLGNQFQNAFQNKNQIKKEIPKYKKKKNSLRKVILLLVLFIIIGSVCILFIRLQPLHHHEERIKVEKGKEQEEKPVDEPVVEPEEEDLFTRLQMYMQNNTTEDNYRIMEEGSEAELELARFLATAYDREEKYEEAVFYYQIFVHLEVNQEQLESAYMRLAMIQEQLETYEEERKTYQEALTKCPKNEKIGIQYLTFICKNQLDDIEHKNQELTELMSKFEKLEETEDYKKIAKEYGIQTEEGKVWIEKEN